MSESGVFTVPLPEAGAISIGRAERCEVRVTDTQLSREHARLLVGDTVQIIDLGSFNGTRVEGRALAPHEPTVLAHGELVSLGSTVLVLQPSSAVQRPRQLWSHGYFESRLEEECARAEPRKATFAVLRVRFDTAAVPSAIESRLSAQLAPENVVGSYAPGEYEVLVTDIAPGDAETYAGALAAKLAEAGAPPEIGVACYPRDGRTPEALVAEAGRRPRGGAPRPEIAAGGALARLHLVAARFAAGTIPVLVLGETGVGKDVLATMIHKLSPRAGRPFVCLNCAALPESLLESELFGFERGAFTGAVLAKEGLLESASGGTVFLDEIGEMPLAVQAKLLRVVDQAQVMRLGATRPRPIDVRFVAATNRDLAHEVERGRFREDLFFRLVAASIVIPPLRERVAEIAPLAATFVAQACRDLGRASAPMIRRDAMEMLEAHSWPGNIRELRNAMERAVLLAGDGDIGVEQLEVEQMGRKLGASGADRRSSPPPRASMGPGGDRESRSSSRALQPRGDVRLDTSPPRRLSGPPLHVPAEVTTALARDPEAARLLAALDTCDWNQTKAATLLGISRRTLVTRLTAYGLTRRRTRD